ncbi:hypothetical protein GH741_00760 [Aquibacillus halophilus]|uniref:Peptidase C39-like domain-containing protein n=1 Tax=Aquibacillus halophilus TaxID=930132 RepID=A0A6A8DIS3_9BACI|nr:C39 family peptidase [Aquibacillus halophilus]MRH41202.1 hypothetical protein [Aquibacillus halophilus]
MNRKIILLTGMLLIGSFFLTIITIVDAQENGEYYLIHYNGEEQQIVINEKVTLILTDWTDETKISVNANLFDTNLSDQMNNITLNVSDNVNELIHNEEESTYYRLVVSETYKVEKIKSTEAINQEESSNDGDSEEPSITNPSIVYSTHVQSYGWMDSVEDGEMAGTRGESKRLEAINIDLQSGPYTGGLVYSTHVKDYGWLNEVSNGEMSGTLGESKRMEAIKIDLTGEIENYYDVYYRVHTQNFGWLGWTKNGMRAGTEGLSKRIEALEIILVTKDGPAPGSTDQPFVAIPSIVYSSHVQSYGWMDKVKNGQISGTKGESKRLEAIRINLEDGQYAGELIYSTHVQGYGWLNDVTNGEVSGTLGESKQMEAIKINLTGEMANHYDVYYRVHSQNYGWLGWARNGMKAGTEGLSKRIEALEIVLVKKGRSAPGSMDQSFVANPSIVYSSHVQSYGWMDEVKNGEMTGTKGESKRLEAININLQDGQYTGGLVYSTHVQDYGWLDDVTNGKVTGTLGESKRMEAIKINLTGEIAKHYDVYYRVHSQNYGWLGWARNGMEAGTEGLSKRIEALEITLVEKGKAAPGSMNQPFVGNTSIVYSSHVQSYGWMDEMKNGQMSGTNGESKRLEAIKISLRQGKYSGGLVYSTHVQDFGWLNEVTEDNISGKTGLNKRMEAIRINLTGEVANHYDVYYRVHSQNYGWLGWAKNGMNAGTEGLSKRIEAIEIKLVSKEEARLFSETKAAFKRRANLKIDAPLILQNPLLPRGCEVTSLAMMLQYAGVNVDKIRLAAEVKKVPFHDGRYYGHPNIGFVGNMYTFDKPGLGAFHSPIENLAKQYLPGRIINLTGQSFDAVTAQIDQGKPVWVIVTSWFSYVPETYWSTWNTIHGDVRITYKMHSVLVTGYDNENLYINDPFGGKNKRVNKKKFIDGWKQYGSQAISYN